MRHFSRFFVLFTIAIACHAADVDVTGTWTVSIASNMQTRETTMRLKQQGQNVMGSLGGPNGAEFPITGTIAGDKISFSYPLTGLRVQGGPTDGPTEITLRYEGTVAGNRMAANAKSPLAGDVTLKAIKQ